MTCLSIKLSHREFSKKKSIKEKFYTSCLIGKGKLLKTCEKLKIHPFYGKGEKRWKSMFCQVSEMSWRLNHL